MALPTPPLPKTSIQRLKVDGREFVYYSPRKKKTLNWIFFALILVGLLVLSKFFGDLLHFSVSNWVFILSVVAIVLGIGVMYQQSRVKPSKKRIELSKKGIRIDEKFYPFEEILSFSVIPRKKISTFYLETNRFWNAIIAFHIENKHFEKVFRFLQERFPYSEPPLTEIFFEKISSWLSF